MARADWSGLFLFHVKQPFWVRAADHSGIEVSTHQHLQMERYGRWLLEEAVVAGGIGPNETERIDQRHLADSVLFASLMDEPSSVWDLGTGVGLPGIPLAILLPVTEFHLIDRSGRRIDLLKRCIRILDLENCQLVKSEISDLSGSIDHIVARASLAPDALLPVARKHLNQDGTAIIGGSWVSPPVHDGWETIEIPASVLDQTIHLLMMRQT